MLAEEQADVAGKNNFESRLHFWVKELGCVKKLDNGSSIYVPGSYCEDALKDIKKYCSGKPPICSNHADDIIRKKYNCGSLFGKWGSLQSDFLPLFLG